MAEDRMSIEQFRADGYLQEANRRFFHPLGLALEVTRAPATGERVMFGEGGVEALRWLIDRAVSLGVTTNEYVEGLRISLDRAEAITAGDAWLSGVRQTSDPEGFAMGDAEELVSRDGVTLRSVEERRRKRENVDRLWAEHAKAREAALGYVVGEV